MAGSKKNSPMRLRRWLRLGKMAAEALDRAEGNRSRLKLANDALLAISNRVWSLEQQLWRLERERDAQRVSTARDAAPSSQANGKGTPRTRAPFSGTPACRPSRSTRTTSTE